MTPPTDWSRDEVELVVADYFAMLGDELAGKSYDKSARNRALRQLLNSRSKGSVEFKHANISAVLVNYGLPYIDGYKPRQNYQLLLEQIVLEWLTNEPSFLVRAEASPRIRPEELPLTSFANLQALIETPPESAAKQLKKSFAPRAVKLDFVRLDAENRRLGYLGEEWALEFERRRLHDLENRPELSKKVLWVSQVEGDGLGYDIRSFDRDGAPRLIEVKTTGLGKYFPFAVTANEVRVSEHQAAHYHLYRVFRFAEDPRVYTLHGALSAVCRLEATQFSARPAAPDGKS